MSTLRFLLLWVFGFFALLSFDLFVEAFVFEWLEWNGTNKNDWFFCAVVGRGRNVVFVRCESYLADTAMKMEARVGIEPA